MCNPLGIAIGGLVLSGVSKVAQHAGAAKEAKANRREAKASFALSVQDIEARLAEERAAASDRIQEGTRSVTQLAATARASAAEAGVTGRSVDLVVADLERQRGEHASSVRRNLEITEDQLAREERRHQSTLEARLNQSKGPSLTSTIIGFAGDSLGFAARRIAQSPNSSGSVELRSGTGRDG